MRAFVMKGIGSVGFMDKPIPDCGPLDAIVKTTAALICTSDSHTVRGAIGPRNNLTLGHEAVGVVYKVGALVRLFRPGDRVVVGAITPDWGSLAAQHGAPPQSNQALGGWKFSNIKDGVFAEYFHVNEADANLAKIPGGVADDAAVYVADMLSTGLAGAEGANIPMGGTVAVFAQGPVGLMATVGARLQGASYIIAVESVPARQALARQYGADEVVDYTKVDVIDRILDLTNGDGVDSAIEALGSDTTFQQAIEVTKPGGCISNIGYHREGEFVHIPRMAWGAGMAQKTIRTALSPGGRLRLSRLLALVEGGRVDPTLMTTHRFPFRKADEAFRIMDGKLDGVLKPLIEF
jgi:threonine dehydrogenase-like Zn-dependent dehydrogenase